MSFTQRLISVLEAGLWMVVKVVIGANRDYPFHDYETATLTATYKPYVVGENNIKGNADQHKYFVSKSTLIYSTTEADVKFNNTSNVEQDILAGILYTFESNISQIYYKYSEQEGTIYIWTEGVLPQETRSPE